MTLYQVFDMNLRTFPCVIHSRQAETTEQGMWESYSEHNTVFYNDTGRAEGPTASLLVLVPHNILTQPVAESILLLLRCDNIPFS